MRIDQVQEVVRGLIAASPELNAFGEVFIEDNVTNLEEPILNAIEKNGACLVIGDIATAQADEGFGIGRVAVSAGFTVFVFENPTTHHEPAGLTLVQSVVASLIQDRNVRFENAERFTAEKGGALSILNFHAVCVINPIST